MLKSMRRKYFFRGSSLQLKNKKLAFKRCMGATRLDGCDSIPEYKESAYLKHKEREGFGASNTDSFITMPFTLATL